MNNKKSKAIRKANQYSDRQTVEIFNTVMNRQLTMPFNTRWRLALKILIGKKDASKI